MIGRVEGTAKGSENAFGITPRYGDLDWKGIGFSQQQFDQVTSLDAAAWKTELGLHAELFQQLAYHLPQELNATKQRIEERIAG
jgi:phosphoenolpyruvate carboxykinase (GTP)